MSMGSASETRNGSKERNQPRAGETCYFCSRGILEEKHVTVDFRWGEQLVIIENVPAKACNECGERYHAAKVVRQMEQIAKERRKEREIRVPVVEMQ